MNTVVNNNIKPIKKQIKPQKRPHAYQNPENINIDDLYCKTVVQLYNYNNEYNNWTPDAKYYYYSIYLEDMEKLIMNKLKII